MTLFEQIGGDNISKVIRDFYDRAFRDPIIGHLFWELDKEHLISRQVSFASSMLGSTQGYQGTPLREAHRNLKLNSAHFGRRQVLMGEVLRESSLSEDIVTQWLSLEERLKPLIINSQEKCND